jgi:putative DNA primase/helicase
LDNYVALQTCRPKLPKTAHNRDADNWRPIFAIAEVAGGDCPELALDAYNHLTAHNDREAQDIGILLLNDIRQIFAASGRDRVHSRDLVATLCANPQSLWLEAHHHKPINEIWLADYLRRFRIGSKTIRIGENRAKGYELTDFAEAFARFLAPEPPQPEPEAL